MYSFSYLEPVCCSMSSSNCCFLTCLQISQEAGQKDIMIILIKKQVGVAILVADNHTPGQRKCQEWRMVMINDKGVVYSQKSEKAMAPHSSTLAWKIPWTEEPGRLQSMGSLRVGQDWATSLSLFTFMHWRRKWQPTPVFLPGESQEWRSLVGCRLWGLTESDTTEVT